MESTAKVEQLSARLGITIAQKSRDRDHGFFVLSYLILLTDRRAADLTTLGAFSATRFCHADLVVGGGPQIDDHNHRFQQSRYGCDNRSDTGSCVPHDLNGLLDDENCVHYRARQAKKVDRNFSRG
jgi:hypothetical protein